LKKSIPHTPYKKLFPITFCVPINNKKKMDDKLEFIGYLSCNFFSIIIRF